jgi:hypothetical protein
MKEDEIYEESDLDAEVDKTSRACAVIALAAGVAFIFLVIGLLFWFAL